jgi:hypothetical protein
MTIPGNPYALIKDGACTEVIAMQDYDADTINKTLESHDYDEIVICSEVGYEIYVGYRYYSDVEFWASLPTHETWVLNKINRRWEPPIPYPTDGAEYNWSEEEQNWVTCSSSFFADEEDQTAISTSTFSKDGSITITKL